tara:strand:- start:199 stop:1227 length:1029 start_codon:yes stop_codon:yes gene_type:complete
MKDNNNLLDNISDEVKIINLAIVREINLFSDLFALFQLILIFRKNNFSLVHSVSPKAGLLSAIAAWAVRVPIRLHTFTGQVWVTKKGISKWILKLLDKLIIALNTKILVDSISQEEFLIKENLLNARDALVLGSGSLSGVDLQRFKPSIKQRKAVRHELNISSDCIVFLFLGRIKKDKGVFELAKSFKNISLNNNNIALLIVGPDEDNLVQKLSDILDFSIEYTRFIDFTKTPEKYMMASDIFVLPSYREGFGSVIIEAASCGIPSIGSDIYGLSDAIQGDETGILIPVMSEKDLEEAMIKLLNNNNLRIKMGEMAYHHAKDNFSQDKITMLLIKLYKELLL